MGYITAEEYRQLEMKLRDARKETKLICKCDTLVKTTHKFRDIEELPYCPKCKILFIPLWNLHSDGTFLLHFTAVPAGEREPIPENWNIIKKGNPKDLHKSETLTTQIEPNPDVDATPQPKNSGVAHQKASNRRKNVRGQILNIFNQKKGIVQTHELLKQIDAADRSIRTALNKLVNEGLVIKVKHGHYRLNKRSQN
ncbi:MAG: type IV toxin-antitoxin system AbiEi family antitoxin domain-containing protein [Candidatus Poribacteria bacterium]|nr:type IV toxin-antitoxin system AbiEi family antitoxin domain-containing protein [Candidatus Poribacteria bacterium]